MIYLYRKGTYKDHVADVQDSAAFVDPKFPERIILVEAFDRPDSDLSASSMVSFYQLINHETMHVILSRIGRSARERRELNLGLDRFVDLRSHRCLIDPGWTVFMDFLGF